MRCGKCGNDNREGRKFCSECGAPLNARCAACGAENEPAEKFCGECGIALAGKVQAVSGDKELALKRPFPNVHVTLDQLDASAKPEGERKTVTALFADIKGSTELIRDLDPEAARAVIDPVLHLMMDAVHRYDGYVVQSAGDGIFALFGAPMAHEDHPQRAVHAAIAMRDAFRRPADTGRPATEIRIGISTGEVVLRLIHTGGHTEYAPVGHMANLAARMQSAAPAAGIAISEDTRQLVEGYFQLRELGPTEVKGIAQPINVYEVIGAGLLHDHFDLAVRRGLTKFVGRNNELQQIVHALERSRGGHGQIVAVLAEAGTGKSRLFYEFKASLPADCKVLEAYSVSHGKASPWLPVLALLHNYFGIQEADGPATRRQKLRAALATLDPALSDTQPYLFSLLAIPENPDPIAHMEAQVKCRRTLDALKRIVLRESLRQPIVISFEDLHWVDEQTQALLDLLAGGISNAHALMLVNYRPEYRHEWGNKSYYSQLRLAALGQESTAEMLSTLLGDGAELKPLKRLIIERTEGNPFFIEEMVQALFDEGAIVRNGVVKLARSLSQVRLPPTVQGILAARIDRLPAAHKELVETLAVMGRESSLALIRQVAIWPDGELEPMLAALQAGEFIYEVPTAAGIEYIFKHVLTQEVAYNSILVARRKQLHEQAAQAIESIFVASLADHYGDLARHYSCSGNGLKAAYYLERAGQQMMTRGAPAEGSVQLARALEFLTNQPDTPDRDRLEIALRLSLSVCMLHTMRWEESEAVLRPASALCEKLHDDGRLFEVLWTLYYQFFVRQQHQKLNPLGKELLTIAQRTRETEMIGRARMWFALSSNQEGNLLAAQEQLGQISQLPALFPHKRDAGIYNWRIQAPAFGSFTFWALGFPDIAVEKSRESLALASELFASRHDMVSVLFWAGFLNLLLRNWAGANSCGNQALRLAQEQDSLPLAVMARLICGCALARGGQLEDGIAEMLRLRTDMAQVEGLPVLLLSMWLADIYRGTGRWAEGLAEADRAIEAIERTGYKAYEAETRRLTGELLLIQGGGTAPKAVQCFREAIEVARCQSAKSWELRTTVSLARLLGNQGHRHEARTVLADIYNWFSEGFDTADLIEAKALLHQLDN